MISTAVSQASRATKITPCPGVRCRGETWSVAVDKHKLMLASWLKYRVSNKGMDVYVQSAVNVGYKMITVFNKNNRPKIMTLVIIC